MIGFRETRPNDFGLSSLLFGGVELRYSKRECLLFPRHAFARSYTAGIDLNAVLLVEDTLKIPLRNGPLAGGVENFPVKTSVFATKRSLADSRACRA